MPKLLAPVRLLVVLLGVLIALPAVAQFDPGPIDPALRAKLKARMTQLRSQVLRDQVGLDEPTAKRLEAVLASYDARRHAIRDDMRNLKREMRALIVADSRDDKAYSRVLTKLYDSHAALQVLREKEYADFQKVLAPRQQAMLLMALTKLRHRAQSLVRQGMGAGPGGPGAAE